MDIFTLLYLFSLISPSLWKTARYRLKYCLKRPLNPQQPTNNHSRHGIMPLRKFHYGNHVRSIILKSFEIFSRNLVQILSIIKGRAENKSHNSTFIFHGIIFLCKFYNGNHARTITPKPFEIFWFTHSLFVNAIT